MNPALPIRYFVPDAEARQWKDGRMYIYGSYDIGGDTFYCSHEYHVFSSNDLVNWTDHGASFRSIGSDSDVPWADAHLYAPDCIYKNGVYYLYFCMADNSEGVATGLNPGGPFKNAVPVNGAHGDGIDPAVLVDDDGKVYYYWGQFKARGARLKDDMASIDACTFNAGLINEAEHGFHEGVSMRKRNGIYYLLYTDISRGKPTCISYATAKSPLGPFEKGGVIIDNTGCDPCTWNNHGSIAEFNGNWYVFYHRSSQGSRFSRRVCIEPIFFSDDDGSIKEVEMTTQGVSGPLEAGMKLDAYRACLLSGKVHTEAVEPGNDNSSLYECLSRIENGDWACYKYLDFSHKRVAEFEIEAASLSCGGFVEVRLDSPEGVILGVCDIRHTGGWKKWAAFSCRIDESAGIHALYLVFKGNPGRLFDLKSFLFK